MCHKSKVSLATASLWETIQHVMNIHRICLTSCHNSLSFFLPSCTSVTLLRGKHGSKRDAHTNIHTWHLVRAPFEIILGFSVWFDFGSQSHPKTRGHSVRTNPCQCWTTLQLAGILKGDVAINLCSKLNWFPAHISITFSVKTYKWESCKGTKMWYMSLFKEMGDKIKDAMHACK